MLASGSLGGALHNLGRAGSGVDHTDGMCVREDAVERAEGEKSAALVEACTVVGRCFEVGGEIISKKVATFYAVSSSVCKLCSLLVASSESISTVSTMMHGEYGIEDVCLSTLTLVGPNGVQGKVPMRMTKTEIEQLKKSADALKEIIAQINLD